ncbi:MAG: inosine/xanthosine triphosphatase [Nitrososphaeria archaeon]
MIVAVGTSNELKVRAAEEAFGLFFNDVKAVGVSVDPGVPPQPFNEELFTGARNRAIRALESVPEAEYGVGIEGGAIDLFGIRLITTAVCIADRKGRLSYGTTGSFPVPESVWRRIETREELGDVMDSVTGIENVKKGIGAIGVYTRGIITRKEYLRDGVIMALTRFVSDEIWV